LAACGRTPKVEDHHEATKVVSPVAAREKPEYRAWSVEVEDLGTDFQSDPDNDLLAWDEVS
jgi:hypothetical protein